MRWRVVYLDFAHLNRENIENEALNQHFPNRSRYDFYQGERKIYFTTVFSLLKWSERRNRINRNAPSLPLPLLELISTKSTFAIEKWFVHDVHTNIAFLCISIVQNEK